MENRPDSKPTLVLMAGFPGAGKTTLAEALGKSLKWPVLDKDCLKKSLLKQNLPFISLRKKGRITYELIFALAADILIRQQLSVILDTSAHRPFIIEYATQIALAAQGKLKVVLCTAQSKLRQERIIRRTDLYLFSTNPFETIMMNEIEHFKHLPEDALIVETKYPLETYLPRALQYLSH